MDDIGTSIQLNIKKSGPRVKPNVKGKKKATKPLIVAPPINEPSKKPVKQIRPDLDEFDGSFNFDYNDSKKKTNDDIKPKTKRDRLNIHASRESKQSHEFRQPHEPVKSLTPFIPSIFTHNPETPTIKLKTVKPVQESLFSKKKFSEADYLHPHLISCLKSRLEVEEMTKVQQMSIPHLIKGEDCLIKSATGSGKTLAYLVPIVQKLQSIEPKLTRSDGIHCLIIVPTRELVAQCYKTLSDLCKSFIGLVPGCLMGGEKKHSEKSRIRKGMTILVATPGRLLDHIESTKNLNFNKVRFLVIDEADRLKEQGFEEAIGKVIDHLKEVCESRPQSVLCSATLSKNVQDLAGMTLEDPQLIDLNDSENSLDSEELFALPSQLNLHFMIVPAKLRLVSLCSFIVDNCSKKVLKALIFMSTQDSVDFHHALFTQLFSPLLEASNLSSVKFFRLHGNMEQSDRMSVFNEFQSASAGILLCTDVAARGLDLLQVDWIVQYSCPSKVEEFVHRVGRTARIGAKGDALLFLLPSEVGFLKLLQDSLRVNFDEIQLENLIKALLFIRLKGKFLGTKNPREFAAKLQQDFEKALYEDECLLGLAKKAFLAFLRAYASYPKETRQTIPFKELHIGHIATSFLLHDTPKELGASAFTTRQKQIANYAHRPRPGERKNNNRVEKSDRPRERRNTNRVDRNDRPRERRNVNPNKIEIGDRKRSLPFEMRASEFDDGFDGLPEMQPQKKKKTK